MKNYEIAMVKECDIKDLYALFYNTVHKVNIKDYTPQQLDVWAPIDIDLSTYSQKILSKYAIMIKQGDKILGYGNIDENGYLDHLYVAYDCQNSGVGRLLCDELEKYVKNKGVKCVLVEASVTAKGFFEHRGYEVIKQQTVFRKGIGLTNYIMKKTF